MDKSHPNTWVAAQLAGELPEALFLGIERNPYTAVASMLKHKEVLNWHETWNKYPVPNEFFGITKDMVGAYNGMPLATKCTYRWISHKKQMAILKELLGSKVKVIFQEPPTPDIRKESITKWCGQLTGLQITQIAEIVVFPPKNTDGILHE